jgi:hypothetical protein
MQRPPRRASSRAPSAARQPRRCAPASGGVQWSAAWTLQGRRGEGRALRGAWEERPAEG